MSECYIYGVMFVRVKPSGPRKYVQIVENFRDNGKIKQKVIANLGRLDILQETGQLDAITCGLARLSKSCAVISANRAGQTQVDWDKEWGPALIFGRLWEILGLPEIIGELKASSKYVFDIERAVFSCVLQRLLSPGSDLKGSKWLSDIFIPGADSLSLHHLYRSMDFLAEHKEAIERFLFDRSRTLFDTEVDLVFFDTTTVYFEGEGPEDFAEYGYSKDHRPDRKQILVGVVMSRCGYPLACEFWPGSTSDMNTVKNVIRIMKNRFSLDRVIFVADRGMVSEANVADLEKNELDWILGVRMRKVSRVRLNPQFLDSSSFQVVQENLHVKEFRVDGERFIVCLNPQEAEKDRKTREEIVSRLKEKLEKNPKQLVGNRGYSRFLKMEKGSMAVDSDKIAEDSVFDGKYVLTTNTQLSVEEVALSYKGLWQVERGFRNLKSALEVRPIYHRTEDRVKGHVFASFLSLVLMTAVERKLEEKHVKIAWGDFIRDLRAFRAVQANFTGKTYLMRTECRGVVSAAFHAVGLRIPPVLSEIGCHEQIV